MILRNVKIYCEAKYNPENSYTIHNKRAHIYIYIYLYVVYDINSNFMIFELFARANSLSTIHLSDMSSEYRVNFIPKFCSE